MSPIERERYTVSAAEGKIGTPTVAPDSPTVRAANTSTDMSSRTLATLRAATARYYNLKAATGDGFVFLPLEWRLGRRVDRQLADVGRCPYEQALALSEGDEDAQRAALAEACCGGPSAGSGARP